MYTRVKTDAEIEAMREGGAMLASVLQAVRRQSQSGMSTKDLADIAARELKGLGAEPAFLGYGGFPDVLCVSLNDEVVHGIPRADRIVTEQDIISIDFGVKHRGMITDAAISYVLDTPPETVQRLLTATEQAMLQAIDRLKSGVRAGDIGSAVQKTLQAAGLGIVRDLVGHGVGHELHEEPNIPNYGIAGSGPLLRAGMTIAIEPMATLGREAVVTDADRWTVRTADRSLAAHFEHTVLITERGAEILTV